MCDTARYGRGQNQTHDWGDLPQINLNESDGWEAWVKNPKDEKSPSLSFVFGRGVKDDGKPCDGKRIALWGNAGNDKVRDYQVTEVSSQLNVAPGGSLSMRWYLVSSTFSDNRKISSKLADKARVSRIQFNGDAKQAIHTENNAINTDGKGEKWTELMAYPAPNTVPIFLLKDKRTGKQLITTDLYAIAESDPYPNPLPKDHKEYERYQNRVIYKQYSPHIGYENLLGFAYKKKPADTAKPLTAPEGVSLHESANGLWLAK